MKETVKSVKIYLVLVGVIGLIVNGIALAASMGSAIGLAISVLGILVSAGYLYGGANAPQLIANNPKLLTNILLAGGGYTLLTMLLLFLFNGGDALSDPVIRKGFIRSVIGLAITAYLYVNVQRLAKENAQPVDDANEFDDLPSSPPVPPVPPVPPRPASRPPTLPPRT